MRPDEERDHLAREICEWVRIMAPQLPMREYLDFRTRVFKTPLPVLREIVESEVVTDTARRVLPATLCTRMQPTPEPLRSMLAEGDL